eukprot:1161805-Pelagomonas_calceolata.AAC.10
MEYSTPPMGAPKAAAMPALTPAEMNSRCALKALRGGLGKRCQAPEVTNEDVCHFLEQDPNQMSTFSLRSWTFFGRLAGTSRLSSQTTWLKAKPHVNQTKLALEHQQATQDAWVQDVRSRMQAIMNPYIT